MRLGFLAGVLVAAACGGGPDPILKNAPRPDPGTVAGAAAAIAGAATLAAPDAAARKAEDAKKPTTEPRPRREGPAVPADVLDRLDAQKQGSAGSGSAAPAGEP